MMQDSVLALARTATNAQPTSGVTAQNFLTVWDVVMDTTKWGDVTQFDNADQHTFYDTLYHTKKIDDVTKAVQKGAHLLAAVSALSLETSQDFDVPATASGCKITITIAARSLMAIPAQKPDFPNDETGDDLDKTKLG